MNSPLSRVGFATLAIAACCSACGSDTSPSADAKKDASSKPVSTSTPTSSRSQDAATPDAAPVDKATLDSNGCPVNSGFVGDERCLAAPAADEGFQLHYAAMNYDNPKSEGPYLLQPGQEVVDCYYMKSPNTKDVYVGGYQFSLRQGSHHFNVDVNTMAQPDGLAACGANDNAPGLLGGTTVPVDDERADPAPENAGLAVHLPANSQIALNFHVINTTSAPILREAWANYYYMDQSDVKGFRGNVFLIGGLGYQIAPGTHKTYTYACSPDRPTRILNRVQIPFCVTQPRVIADVLHRAFEPGQAARRA